MSNLMCGVNECVSLIQTTRTLLLGISKFGGFIVIFITRCVLTISRHAAVGSCVNSCTSIVICLHCFASDSFFFFKRFNCFTMSFDLIIIITFKWTNKRNFFLFVMTFVYSINERCKVSAGADISQNVKSLNGFGQRALVALMNVLYCLMIMQMLPPQKNIFINK